MRLSEVFPITTAMTLCRWILHDKALQATVSEGLAQGSYVAARAGLEPTTIRSKGIDYTNAAIRPTKPVLSKLFWLKLPLVFHQSNFQFHLQRS